VETGKDRYEKRQAWGPSLPSPSLLSRFLLQLFWAIAKNVSWSGWPFFRFTKTASAGLVGGQTAAHAVSEPDRGLSSAPCWRSAEVLKGTCYLMWCSSTSLLFSVQTYSKISSLFGINTQVRTFVKGLVYIFGSETVTS